MKRREALTKILNSISEVNANDEEMHSLNYFWLILG